MQYKTLVILIKSKQRDGYCIAGRELYLGRREGCLGGWFRLVSSDKFSQGAILQNHLGPELSLNVLDVVLVPVKTMQPELGQPDNLLIDECDSWVIKGKIPDTIVSGFVESPDNLWWQAGVPNHIVPKGKDDEKYISQSLYLVKTEQLKFILSHQFNRFKAKYERKIRVSFQYHGHEYRGLSLRDVKVRRMLSGQYPDAGSADKVITLLKGDNYYLCVSLGTCFGVQKNHYKAVDTVFDFDGYLQANYG